MFDPLPRRKAGGRLPVWPYFLLSLAAAAVGLVLIVVWWPGRYPDQSDLVMMSGEIATVVVRDDISHSSAGAAMPAATSVYFTLEGVDGEFRYPSSQPGYPIVRDRTAHAIDVWVDRAEIGAGGPLRIWQIRERNPYNVLGEQTFVGRDEIVERLDAIDRSMIAAGVWCLAAALALAALGLGVGRWNRGRAAPRV